MSEAPAVVFVDIKQAPLSRIPGRPQRWYWIAKSAGNQKRLARSTERYTNRADCVAAVWLLFHSSTTVFQREVEYGNIELRRAQ